MNLYIIHDTIRLETEIERLVFLRYFSISFYGYEIENEIKRKEAYGSVSHGGATHGGVHVQVGTWLESTLAPGSPWLTSRYGNTSEHNEPV